VLKKKNKRSGWLAALMRSDVGVEERRSTQQQWLIDVANIMYEKGTPYSPQCAAGLVYHRSPPTCKEHSGPY
jgi:hypothetical protein